MSTYDRIRLRDAIRLASKALASKPPTHEGKCIRLRGDTVTAVGLCEAIEVEAGALVEAEGDELNCMVVAADLLTRLDASTEEKVSLALDGWKLVVKAKRSRWTLDAFEATAPSGRIKRPGKPMTVDLAAFRTGLDAVLPVAGTEPDAPQYLGVQIQPSGRLITTDGRGAHAFDGGPKVPFAMVITAAFAKILCGLKVDTIAMSVDTDRICVEVPGVVMAHRQLGTAFVPAAAMIERVWSELGKDGKVATVASADFIAALEAASLAAEFQHVSLSMVDGQLGVTGRKSGDASSCEVTGEVEAVVASAPFLGRAVKACASDRVDVRTSKDILVGIVVTAAGTEPGGPCAMVGQIHQGATP
jgi:hypothetical protein